MKKNLAQRKLESSPKLLGEIIRQERKRRNLTQTMLGDLSGTSINFISQVESGKTTAQIGKVLRVLQILGVQLEISYGSRGLVNRLRENGGEN
jgi:HTH-type transcriptional regulator/antitoxin HipB